MASFERRFLTIKVAKFSSTEAEVLVITVVIPEIRDLRSFEIRFERKKTIRRSLPEIVGMYIFIYGFLFANFVMIFVAHVL